MVAVMSRSCGGRLDGGGDALIATATADIAAHCAVYVVFGGVLARCEQCGGLHDLASLTIAALRHIERAPSLLHGMVPLRIEPLDRRHRPARDIVHGGDAGASRRAVDMNGASAAQRHTAAKLCSGKSQFVPQIPEQRHRRIAVERLLLAVDAQLDHGVPPGLTRISPEPIPERAVAAISLSSFAWRHCEEHPSATKQSRSNEPPGTRLLRSARNDGMTPRQKVRRSPTVPT